MEEIRPLDVVCKMGAARVAFGGIGNVCFLVQNPFEFDQNQGLLMEVRCRFKLTKRKKLT